VFLRYYVTIGRSSEEVETALAGGVENWMPALVQQANGHGMRLLSELGFHVGKSRVQRRIEVKVGRPQRTGLGPTLVPIQWRAASATWLFPALDGQLEIAGLGPTTTQLGLSASYEPPLGLVGKFADRALLHRVAELTVKDFLDSVGKRFEQSPSD
jgi:hypothetical protein